MAASTATAIVPCPTRAKEAAEMIASVLPLISSDHTGWWPTSEARNGSTARE
jgi:hypothetical protein